MDVSSPPRSFKAFVRLPPAGQKKFGWGSPTFFEGAKLIHFWIDLPKPKSNRGKTRVSFAKFGSKKWKLLVIGILAM